MAYEFFFSYTRADNDKYLKQFFEVLNDAVRRRRGLPHGASVGFFDQRELELGDEWDVVLADALRISKTIVCLYSPGYFKSEYCGREWEVFRGRRKKYVDDKLAAGEVNVLPPPVLKPVVWMPLPPGESAPEAVGGPQYMRGDPQAVHNTFGLRRLRKQYTKFKDKYDDFIEALADEIIAAANTHHLPELAKLTPLKQVPSAFHPPPVLGVMAPAKPSSATGPKFVQFAFVAAHPDQLVGQRATLDCYLQEGGRDWKPYFPQKAKPIRALVQSVASGHDLDFYSEELTVGSNLAQDVRNALLDRKVVVLVVDSWTAGLPPYDQILWDFDQQNYLNCCVLIPWNEGDSESAQSRVVLEQNIQNALHFRVTSKNPLHFRDNIGSEEEFCQQLHDVLVRLKAEIINKAEPRRSSPTGGEMPIISASRGNSGP
jgi:FxsC-like protein